MSNSFGILASFDDKIREDKPQKILKDVFSIYSFNEKCKKYKMNVKKIRIQKVS